MAMPATARRSELVPSKLQSDLDSQLPTHDPFEHRATTPRPSISPLSMTSRAQKSSPSATRDAAMSATQLQEETEVYAALSTADADVGEQQDDRSSSLSEPDDEQDVRARENDMTDALQDGEALSTQRSLDVDSEAETDRLDETPQKLHKHADSLGKTPSKLSQAATADDELSEPPSPLLAGAGAASSTSTVATAGKKRKRSDTAESPLTSAESDVDESPRKRNHASSPDASPNVDEYEEKEEEEDDEDEEEEEELEQEEKEGKNADDRVGAVEEDAIEETPMLEEVRDTPTVPATSATKGKKGKKGKQKGKKQKGMIEKPPDEAAHAVEKPSEEAMARTEETEASSLFDELAKRFHSYRDNLYNERLATLDGELNLLNQPQCTHPEYLRQIACVDARLEKQTREAYAYHTYRQKSIRERTIGDRSQLHSQYFQRIRQVREDLLYRLGEDWHNIQRERRQSHQEKEDSYIFKFPEKRSVQIRQQAKYNQEVSVLSGVAMYVGFPAAPEMVGVQGDGLEDDLKAMKILRRTQQATAHSHTVYLPRTTAATVTSQNDRLAEQQFIESTAWARPQAPLHTHGTPNLTHTPDWAEQPVHSSARSLIRNLSGQVRTSSPFATPMPQQRVQLDGSSSGTVAVNSDGAEAPSSLLTAPPTNERFQLLQRESNDQNSPLTVAKQRQNGDGTNEREFITGFRNISNISGVSGASTIDAPVAEASEQEREMAKMMRLPALSAEVSAPQQAFDTSQLHRSDGDRKEVYTTASFRPQEGAFGTPTPLPDTSRAH